METLGWAEPKVAIPDIEIELTSLNAYGWTATILTILLIALAIAYEIWMRRKFKLLGYYDPKHEIPIEFKPLKNFSLEEYIALLPKIPKTAPQAMLVELDRQGKIEITGSKFKRKVADLSESEQKFLDILENQSNAAHNFLYKEHGVSLRNSAKKLQQSPSIHSQLVEKGLLRKNPNSIRVTNPLGILLGVLFTAIVVFYGVFNDGTVFSFSNSQVIMLCAVIFVIAPLAAAFLDWQKHRFITLAKYTPKGVAVLDYYAGLKRYIKHVEKDRLDLFQNKHESEFLELTPYLILFGMEKTWTNRLQRYQRTWADYQRS